MRLIITGGGTGGHLIPGITLAERFIEKGHQVLFVCGKGDIDLMLLSRSNIPFNALPARGFARKSIIKKIWAVCILIFSLLWAIKIIIRYSPDCVIGVGGYASMPISLAAVLLRKPLFLQEQNSVPGIANRFLARFAKEIYLGFEMAKKSLPERKCIISGNPLRKEFLNLVRPQNDDRVFRILVLGGSQGSVGLNNMVKDALESLKRRGVRFYCIHQAGHNNTEKLKREYNQIGMDKAVEVHAFIDNIWEYYLTSDIVICRAGAITVSEVIATESVAIFVPLSWSSGNHQYYNAMSLVEDNAAYLIKEEDGSDDLADLIEELYISDEKIEIARGRIRLHKKEDPTGKIVKRIVVLCS